MCINGSTADGRPFFTRRGHISGMRAIRVACDGLLWSVPNFASFVLRHTLKLLTMVVSNQVRQGRSRPCTAKANRRIVPARGAIFEHALQSKWKSRQKSRHCCLQRRGLQLSVRHRNRSDLLFGQRDRTHQIFSLSINTCRTNRRRRYLSQSMKV